MEYIVIDHARDEMARRGVTDDELQQVLTMPEQTMEVWPGRVVLQSRLQKADKHYLLRVFVDVDREPAEVVTVYRTSKIAKYWGTS